jgi:hypothetical protein
MPNKKITLEITIDGAPCIVDAHLYTQATPSNTSFVLFCSEENNWSIYDEWNDWFHNGTLPTKKEEEKKPKNCWHEWKEYTGFTEHYWYCEKCDAKSEENPNKCF